MSSEHFRLKFSEFQDCITQALGTFRDDKVFTDVTLASEDGQQLGANQCILAMSSPFFKTLLTQKEETHPIIYMTGVKFRSLTAIVDFLYCGQAQVFHEDMDDFRALAEDLQLKGFSKDSDDKQNVIEELNKITELVPKLEHPNMIHEMETTYKKFATKEQYKEKSDIYKGPTEETIVTTTDDIDKLDALISSKMEKNMDRQSSSIKQQATRVRNEWKCKVCGKTEMKANIVTHIEAKHIQGFVHPCYQCSVTYSSRNALAKHIPKCEKIYRN
jgi:hypothetical protein